MSQEADFQRTKREMKSKLYSHSHIGQVFEMKGTHCSEIGMPKI